MIEDIDSRTAESEMYPSFFSYDSRTKRTSPSTVLLYLTKKVCQLIDRSHSLFCGYVVDCSDDCICS